MKSKISNRKKNQLLKVWMKRAEKPLRKVRGIQKLKALKIKRLQKKRFITWVDETNFLITLE